MITPIKPFSSLDIAWTEWSEAPRFGKRYRHLSRTAMGDDYRVGVGIEELPPGNQSSPAHLSHLRGGARLYPRRSARRPHRR
jgi:hypothetical protein